MFESNKEKQEMYERIAVLKERAQNGELTKSELKELCETAFGKDSDLSKHMQNIFIKTRKINPNHTKKKYLTVEDKKELLLKGERIPLNVYKEDPKAKKNRKKAIEQLNKNFGKNISR